MQGRGEVDAERPTRRIGLRAAPAEGSPTRRKRRPQCALEGDRRVSRNYLCTRPDPPPFNSAFTSSTVNRLKSPGIECFKQLAATANSRASLCVLRFWKP